MSKTSKAKTAFFCQQCGHESSKWLGRCPTCGEWNSFVEEVSSGKTEPELWEDGKNVRLGDALPLDAIPATEGRRIVTPDAELNRVLGGGIVPGSLILVGGEPGIGKSTLLLQLALGFQEGKILYVSGEESGQQIKMRAERLHGANEHVYISTETNLSALFKQIKHLRPACIIIDSVQTLASDFVDATAGSIAQIRESAAQMQRYAKESEVPVFLIGHINKEGYIAGPKILEHMVDTVLQFEGDRNYTHRILRTVKNRFGSTDEIGIYRMEGEGLQQVSNPSELLITSKTETLSGVAIAATAEGMRPMLVEVQALVSPAVYGTPQRTATGFDLRRMSMLLAVLEKRGGFSFGNKDVFLNIAGGLRVEDPAIDLAIACALLSSFTDIAIPHQVCFCAEIGLSGELRGVNRIEQRVSEAEKSGFESIWIAKNNLPSLQKGKFSLEIRAAGKLEEVYGEVFG